MKARLAVLVVALALAIAGAFGAAPSRAALSDDASPPALAVAIEPQIQPDQQLEIDPGGWWDWH
jgi:hypothetical protein